MAVARRAEAVVGRGLEAVARIMALGGGLVLVALALLTLVSVTGRALVPFGLSPVKGDFELVAMGCAIAVFSFLPWCQMRRGHVTVDVMVARLPERTRAALGMAGDMVMTLVSFVILWRLWLGFGERFPHGSDALRATLGMGMKPFFPQTTYELEIEVWVPYALALGGAALFFVVCAYTVWRSLNWVLDGREGLA